MIIVNYFYTPFYNHACVCILRLFCLHRPTRDRPIQVNKTSIHPPTNLTRTHLLNKMTLESDAVAGATIELLEARLRRLSYLLNGDTHWTGELSLPAKPDNLDDTVSRRLLRLEKDLEKLSRSVPAIRDVIQLRMYILNIKNMPQLTRSF